MLTQSIVKASTAVERADSYCTAMQVVVGKGNRRVCVRLDLRLMLLGRHLVGSWKVKIRAVVVVVVDVVRSKTRACVTEVEV